MGTSIGQGSETRQAAQLQWLVDRAEITDLVLDFARCVDDRDIAKYADNFTEDGELVLPFAHLTGREQILTIPELPARWATHHLIGNILIDIDGDVARTRTYVQATHVFDTATPSDTAQAGGWYLQDLRRTSDGWRFTRAEIRMVWETEKPLFPGTQAG